MITQDSLSIKELRTMLAEAADTVESGKTLKVYRRSKPSFKIVPFDTATDEQWETVIDFTDNGKQQGLNIKEALKSLL